MRTPTRISDFNIGEPVESGGTPKVAGILQRWTVKDGWRPYADREVTLPFRPKGGKSFAVVDTLKTRDDGRCRTPRPRVEKAGTSRSPSQATDPGRPVSPARTR